MTWRGSRLLRAAAMLVAVLLPLNGCGARDPVRQVRAAALNPDPAAFLAAIYQGYYSGPSRRPWTAYRAELFDADGLRLMQQVEAGRTAARPVSETDPLCECRDHGKVLTVITITTASAGAAHADVALEDHRMKTLRTVAIDLVRENGAWRIHDITSAYGTTLRETYEKARADLRAVPQAPQ